jgi:hypothetical protein
LFTISRYTPQVKQTWDAFVASAKNSTFLFYRDYMDYHADRFRDGSLLFHRKGQLAALLPANLDEASATLVSHGGLTFGGVVTGADMTAGLLLDLFADLCAHLRAQGIARLLYKAVPHIYHHAPAEEDCYALFRAGARLVRRDLTATVALQRRLPWQERRRRGVKKAQAAGLEIRQTTDLPGFWPILEDTLRARHGVRPVHSLAEIQSLQQRFPDHIKLFAVYRASAMIAGVVVYEHRRVAHAQYIAAGPEGRQHGALDLVFDHLLSGPYQDHDYFDFGISTEEQGKVLNVGLSEHKEGFGARAVVHDFYELDLAEPELRRCA